MRLISLKRWTLRPIDSLSWSLTCWKWLFAQIRLCKWRCNMVNCKFDNIRVRRVPTPRIYFLIKFYSAAIFTYCLHLTIYQTKRGIPFWRESDLNLHSYHWIFDLLTLNEILHMRVLIWVLYFYLIVSGDQSHY